LEIYFYVVAILVVERLRRLVTCDFGCEACTSHFESDEKL